MISSLLITLAGGMFLKYTENVVMGWSFILLSILVLLLGMGTLFDRKPKIILTQRGITETSTLREEIEWDAIRQVDDFWYRGQFFVRLLVDRDYKTDVLHSTWFHRFDRLYAQEGVKALYFRVSLLKINSAQLVQLLRKMRTGNKLETLKMYAKHF